VHEERGAIVEVEELMLPAAGHVVDASPTDATHDGRREGPPLRPVMHPDVLDAPAAERPPESTDGELDLGELRHSPVQWRRRAS
jgi:hypothetical protein